MFLFFCKYCLSLVILQFNSPIEGAADFCAVKDKSLDESILKKIMKQNKRN